MKAILSTLFLFSIPVFAQDCGCDHVISSGTSDVNGNVMSIDPGDTICISSGARDRIKFRNFSGTSENPVVIINCGGQVAIDPTTYSYGIKVENVDYVKFTGSGDENVPYGFRVSGTTGYGIDMGLLTNHFELDHFEFEETGDYAIYYKNDPTCDLSANKGVFTLEDSKINNVHIFDCNKGIRMGSIEYDLGIYNPTCGTLYPHTIENLELSDLIIETITGGDAIRLYGVETSLLSNITIDDVSGRGITIGTHSEITLLQTSIMNTANEGFRALGSGKYALHNNVFYNNGDATHEAIEFAFEDSDEHLLGNSVSFTNNTVVNSARHNFSIISSGFATETCIIKNNVFVNPEITANPSYPYSPFLNITDTTLFLISFNSYSLDYTLLNFVNYSTQDFRLTHESPLINAGNEAITEEDFDHSYRVLAGQVDIGAFEYVPERRAYFDQINLQGLYVNDFKFILGDEGAENDLLQYAQDSGFNYLILYNLTYIHNNLYDLTETETAQVFADFILKAKTEYGVVQIGVVGETNSSFDKIEDFNNLYDSNWDKTVDVLNLEFEFWNTNGSSFQYYCDTYLTPNSLSCNNSGAFTFAYGQMDDIDQRADQMGVLSEIYLGSPTNQQMLDLAEVCDRVLLHCYRSSDTYSNGNSIYNYKKERVEQIALSTRKPAIMPLFAATPDYMQTWLETHTLATPMNTWLYGQNSFDDASAGVQNLDIAGYTWYRYTDLIPSQNKSAITGDSDQDQNAIETTQDSEVSTIQSTSTVSIYPNPFSESTTLHFGQELNGEYSLKIIDVTGREVFIKTNIKGTQIEILRNDLHRGIYTIVMVHNTTGEVLINTKLIVD